ncbi:DUF6504 family protein [Symbiobacterium thermophilum]|uniref:DUF6504 domain-containing protein n=1 Tax=Symbiobacterium thermophilum (strain DSM 24528 / JCM 14929 / IAM 14863 / T) TaxID=292459 RepID=Q67N71_SYMTH|nr:DUF6504 family protein [Symbiobacterium thermophilum]BAD40872.1 hypothetical protein STH1887 [Symbiobacterium thermophilum IAM 14863]
MSRILNRPVDVTTGPDGRPAAFRFAGGRERVCAVLDTWMETGRWWEQEPELIAYRVETESGGVFELNFIPREQRWLLYKAYD